MDISEIRLKKVYLRARGGTRVDRMIYASPEGLSPRTRRNQIVELHAASPRGSISAHAEEPASGYRRTSRTRVYLRARGGTWVQIGLRGRHHGLSPRTRRNPIAGNGAHLVGGSISAHAEEPPRARVYLRARGGTVTDADCAVD